MAKAVYDKAYFDTRGQGVYRRHPNAQLQFDDPYFGKTPMSRTKSLSSTTPSPSISSTSSAPPMGIGGAMKAMDIYEKWMEPGWGSGAKKTKPSTPPERPPSSKPRPMTATRRMSEPKPPPPVEKKPNPPPRNEPEFNTAKSRRGKASTLKALNDKNNSPEEKKEKPKTPNRSSSTGRVKSGKPPNTADGKPGSRRGSSQKERPATAAKKKTKQEDEDAIFEDLYGWVSNGRDNDVDRANDVLFTKKKKK